MRMIHTVTAAAMARSESYGILHSIRTGREFFK